MISKNDLFFDSCYVDLRWILAPSWGSQGGPWRLLETHFLTFGGLDWLWGLTLGGLHWLLGPRWPKDHSKRAPETDFLSPTWPPDPLHETQLGPTWLQQGPCLAPSWTQLDTKSSHNSHHRNVHTQKPRACIKDQSQRRGRR